VVQVSPKVRRVREYSDNLQGFSVEVFKVGERFVINIGFVRSGRLLLTTIGNSAAPGDRVCVLRGKFPASMLIPGTVLFRQGV
jgi:hypothetical protein